MYKKFLLLFCFYCLAVGYIQDNQQVVFRIQLGVATKMPDSASIFRKDFEDIEGIELEDGKIRVYTGKFETYHEASEFLESVKAKGYKYATVVAFYKGKRISTDKAMEIIYGD